MAQMLTAKQVAEVKGCSYQYVKRILQEGKPDHRTVVNSRNRKIYQIPWRLFQRSFSSVGIKCRRSRWLREPSRRIRNQSRSSDTIFKWNGRKWILDRADSKSQNTRCTWPRQLQGRWIRNLSLLVQPGIQTGTFPDILIGSGKSVREDDLSRLIDSVENGGRGAALLTKPFGRRFSIITWTRASTQSRNVWSMQRCGFVKISRSCTRIFQAILLFIGD